jgi:hypothetical protein
MSRQEKATANDRTRAILRGAESRLRRLGKKRGRTEIKRAYATAADKIHKLAGR